MPKKSVTSFGKRLWGGAFSSAPDRLMLEYTTSDVQKKQSEEEALLAYDLKINSAHARMLFKQGIIGKKEYSAIQKGLDEIGRLSSEGKFGLDEEKEDGQTNIEAYLSGHYGALAGSLHAGKSRNDQAVAASRLFAKDALSTFKEGLLSLVSVLDKKSGQHQKTSMPGFTHHQPAMPTTFGCLLDSYAESLRRDAKLIGFALGCLDESPMGAAAGYGTSFPIDRVFVAGLLGFSRVQKNTIDVVTNRGEHEALALFAYCQSMGHLSGLAETLIILSMPQTGWVTLADEYCTGSSIMPQKKNPDALEITKAKAAFAQSCLLGSLSLSKSSFFGYNRDSQYHKKFLINCALECKLAPAVLAGVVSTMAVNGSAMQAECGKHGIGATAEVENLVKQKKMTFRDAKGMVEKKFAKTAK